MCVGVANRARSFKDDDPFHGASSPAQPELLSSLPSGSVVRRSASSSATTTPRARTSLSPLRFHVVLAPLAS
ncbi:hypothetical protein GQ55_2G336800 [Panicum hallii var. hallii]|uniref:Uncharacterized protein n=1 Tax=Panicum hallii var. hallii TaxID=1504633 RepID=A0A2T7EV76_9POAL|nr:hypothetical protein GQ55_2G336800 [Panicum hallii var. hallii]